MLEESTGFGFLFWLVNMWRPRCVFMEKYASVLGSGAVVPNPVSYLKVNQCQLGNRFLYNEVVICN